MLQPPEATSAQAESSAFAPRGIRLLSDPSELRNARGHVEKAAAEFGLDGTDRFEFVFAVNEAVTNAIRHGKPHRDGTIGLGIAANGNTLVCSVYDCGRLRACGSDSDLLAEGGRGLSLMKLMADRVELLSEDGGTTVRLYKRRPVNRTEADG